MIFFECTCLKALGCISRQIGLLSALSRYGVGGNPASGSRPSALLTTGLADSRSRTEFGGGLKLLPRSICFGVCSNDESQSPKKTPLALNQLHQSTVMMGRSVFQGLNLAVCYAPADFK